MPTTNPLTQDHEVACQGTPVQSDLIMCLQLAAQIGRETRRSACFSLYTAPSVDESDGKTSAAAIFFLVCYFFFFFSETLKQRTADDCDDPQNLIL